MSTYLVLKPEEKYALSIVPEAVEQKRKAIAHLEAITQVTNAEELQAAATALAGAAGVVKAMEITRKDVKAPVLDAGKRIDTMAAEFSEPIEAKMEPLRKMVSKFHADEAARVRREQEERERQEYEAEQARFAEEARILQERQDREKREAQEAARVAQAQAAPAENEDPFAALRATSEQEEREEAARKATEAENAKLAALESDRITAQSQLAKPSAPAKASGVSSRKVWKYEVLDPAEVYKHRPSLCRIEVIPSHVTQLINGHIDPLRECPGLRIYEDVETKVRAK